jgi:3-dehydroquinate dehydratase
MMLDLREFGTRERIYGDQVQPYLAPNEASKQGQQNVNTQFSKSLQEQQRIQSISERYNKSTLDGGKSN